MVNPNEFSALSISELSSLIKDGLDTLFPEKFWVEGQISNFKTSRPGHCYFDLIEPNDEPGQPPTAVLNVALWQSKRNQVEKVLTDSGNLTLSNDLQVRVLVGLNFYPPSGRLNLIMDQIDPSFTLGQLAIEREKLLQQLLDEGLLEKNASLLMEIGMGSRAIKEAAPTEEILDEIREAFVTDGSKRLKNGLISYGATIYRVSAVA